MKKSIFTIFILAMIAGSGQGLGFMVTPPRYELAMVAGQSQTYTLTVINTDSLRPVRLQAQVLDWTMKPNGQVVYPKAGTNAQACSRWIEVNPTEFEVPPNTNQEVRFTIAVPESSFGSYWSMIFFESQSDTISQGTIGMLMKARVGASVYITVPGTEVKQAELMGFSYQRKGYRDHEFKLQLRNTGNVHLRPKGTLTIKDGAGAIAGSISLNEEVILPQSQRDFILPLKQTLLAPGRYTAVINLDCGTPELIQGETAFEVVK